MVGAADRLSGRVCSVTGIRVAAAETSPQLRSYVAQTLNVLRSVRLGFLLVAASLETRLSSCETSPRFTFSLPKPKRFRTVAT
jgi:hypothetical protein